MKHRFIPGSLFIIVATVRNRLLIFCLFNDVAYFEEQQRMNRTYVVAALIVGTHKTLVINHTETKKLPQPKYSQLKELIFPQ